MSKTSKKQKKGRYTPRNTPTFRVETGNPAEVTRLLLPIGASHGGSFDYQAIYLGENASLLIEPGGTCEGAGDMVVPNIIFTDEDGIVTNRICLHCAIDQLNESPVLRSVSIGSR